MAEQRHGIEQPKPGKTPGQAEGELQQESGTTRAAIGKTPGKAEGDVATIESNLQRQEPKDR